MNTYRKWSLTLSLVLCVLVLFAISTTSTTAQDIDGLSLTPRPTTVPKTPTTTMPPPTSPEPAASEGAQIWLRVKDTPNRRFTEAQWRSLWTVVQWQDAAGNWYDVEGWQGELDDWTKEGRKVWWLSERLFGAGPFRWVVYERQQDQLTAESQSFYLPSSSDQIVYICMSIQR